MKKLLPILLCYLLMTSQVFAISGGPTFGGGSINPTGTYSGLIVVDQELNNTLDPRTGAVTGTVANPQPNAIGLFSLGVPTTSIARGAALIFVEGVVYTGTISASVNPDSDVLAGIINATFQYIIQSGTSSITVTAQANGQVKAQISGTRPGSLGSARLLGSSTIQVANGGLGGQDGLTFIVNSTLKCTVTGFRQSTTASTVTTLTTT